MDKLCIQRSISIPHFLETRSNEIAHFIKALNERALKKRSYQTLPKSLRRRAMSHNRYRIPSRLRQGINQQLKTVESIQRIPKCRKSIRRRPLLIKEYKKRDQKCKWLSTHIWSAKRMHMMQYFGYKIARSPNDKSSRACYRFVNYGCCLYDLSYYQTLKLTFRDEEQMKTSLKNHLRDYYKFQEVHQNQYFITNLYANQQSKQMICPAYIFKSQCELFILFHPAAHAQLEALSIQCQNKQIYQRKIQIYKLMGPESLVKVYDLLENMDYKIQSNHKLSKFRIASNPNLYDKGLTIQIDVKDCQYKDRLISSPAKLYSGYIKQQYTSTSNQKLRETLLKMIEEEKMEIENEKKDNFWSILQNKQEEQAKFDITTRSKYTHKRNKVKTNKEEYVKQRMLIKQNPLLVKIVKEKKPIIQIKQQKVIKAETLTNKKDTRVMVALVNNQKLTDGCLIICKNIKHSYLWRKLVFLNSKVIGRKELVSLMYQSKQKIYPEDYPETNGYKMYMKQLIEENIQQYRKKPLGKGVNYQKIKSPMPFGADFGALSKNNFTDTFVRVQCAFVGRGTCQTNSYICLPTEQDLNRLKQLLRNSEPLSHLHQEREQQQIQQKQIEVDSFKVAINKLNTEQLLRQLKKINTTRRIIGFATAGGYSLRENKGFGTGYILKQFQHYDYLLVRKTTSPYYFIVEVNVLP